LHKHKKQQTVILDSIGDGGIVAQYHLINNNNHMSRISHLSIRKAAEGKSKNRTSNKTSQKRPVATFRSYTTTSITTNDRKRSNMKT